MDNFKPKRGGFKNRAAAANAARKRELTSLYQSSELSEEEQKMHATDDELINNNQQEPADIAEVYENAEEKDELSDLDLDADLDNYIQDAPTPDEEDVPLKKSAAKKQKQAKIREEKAKKTKPKIALIIVLILLLGGLGTGAFFLFKPTTSETPVADIEDKSADTAKADEIYYSALTGREISDANQVHGATTCVMIENSLDARPQSGLDQAGVVYEAWAEGGITRFMALFQEAKPNYVGPVRSVRLTFAHLAKPYHCSIAHVGGAKNALELIRAQGSGYRDIDQFFNGDYYWRIGSRAAPHNVYTSFEKLDKLNFSKGYNESNYKGFSRVKADTDPEIKGESAKTVNIIMVSGNGRFNPSYSYDSENNRYLRSYAQGGPHMSRDEGGNETQNAPTVVIAAKVAATERPGGKGFSDYLTTGENDAYIFQNGTVVPGKWKRKDVDSELKFYDNDGNEILLNRGQVWISLYPEGTGSVNWE